MKKILFLVNELSSANGICCLSIMNKLSENGCNVYCLSNDEKKYEDINTIDRISLYKIRPRLNYLLNDKVEIINNVFLRKVLLKIIKIINKIKLFITLPIWPWISPLYTLRIYKKAKQIVQTEKIDCIVSVYSQIDTLIVGNRLKNENKNIEFIAYFLDSLSGGYGPKIFSREWVLKRGVKWENKLLKDADKIIMMESAFNNYCNIKNELEYYNKIVFLDLPLLEPKQIKNKVSKLNNKDKDIIKILYVGTLPVGVRNPEYFLQIFDKIKLSNIELIFIGDSSCNSLLKYAKKDKRISVLGRMEHRKISKYEEECDFFLNVGNSNPYMTPSKIFEYMSYGKPIISTCPIENEPSKKYLNKYELVYYLKEYETENHNIMASELEKFIVDYRLKEIDVKKIKNVFVNNLPQTTARYIVGDYKK